jgi:hypothetical protein
MLKNQKKFNVSEKIAHFGLRSWQLLTIYYNKTKNTLSVGFYQPTSNLNHKIKTYSNFSLAFDSEVSITRETFEDSVCSRFEIITGFMMNDTIYLTNSLISQMIPYLTTEILESSGNDYSH